MAVQYEIHARQRPGRVVHLLAIDGDAARRLVSRLEQQRARTAGGIVDGLILAGVRADADHLCHDPRDFCRGIELPLALAGLGGEVPHEVLVGVAEEIVAADAVGAEVEPLEDGDELRKPVLHFLAGAKLAFVVEVGLVDDALEFVGFGKLADDLVDPVADFLVALEFRHVVETTAVRHFDERVRVARVLVRDVLHEQQRQHIILVLGGIHAAAQFVAALPERGIELGFFEGHQFFRLARLGLCLVAARLCTNCAGLRSHDGI